MAHSKNSRKNAAAKAVVTDPAAAPTVPAEIVPAPDAAAAAVPAVVPATAVMNHVLRLGAALSIREVNEYAAEFLTLLNVGPTDIDATGLETIDTAGIQMLLAAGVAAQRRGFRLKLTGAMGVKTGAARSLGLSEHLSELTEIVP